MATYLLAASPIHGHVGPILEVAAYLHDRGHTVTLLTGSRFRAAVEARGIRFESLSGTADFDDRDPDTYIPDRERYRGIRRAQYEIGALFIDTIPDQGRALAALVDELAPDAILVDNAFGGALPLTRRSGARPAVAALGVTPLSQADHGLAPHGMGLPVATNPIQRVVFRAMGLIARGILFRRAQRTAELRYRELGLTLDFPFMDIAAQYDVFFQTGPRSLDYPRPNLSPGVQYVGVIPQQAKADPDPAWWNDLDGSKPVVHVTQGTIDNLDFGRVVRPTLEALATEDVLVVVTAGGRPVEALGPLPANARAASYLSYDDLLPRTDVMITNAGFGGVQAALAAGVPLVLAGVTEDKPEVTARVAWAGAGIDLRTGTPTSEAVGHAVRRVLTEPGFRASAARLRDEIATIQALPTIEAGLAATAARTHDRAPG
jgi:MGT family glycosyltransferase